MCVSFALGIGLSLGAHPEPGHLLESEEPSGSEGAFQEGDGLGEAGGSGSGSEPAETAASYDELSRAPYSTELPGRLIVYFLDVGQGDAAYVRTPTGKVAVIDAGDDPDTVPGFLRGKGVTRVDFLILSHSHADHIGGALRLLEQFEIGEFVDSGFMSTSPAYLEVLETALELQRTGRLTYREPKAGDVIGLDDKVRLETLHPARETSGGDANSAGLVFRLVYGEFSVLFAADIGSAEESDMLERGAIVGSTVLKVAHHGSAGSSSARFLAAVSPKVAVIEVGENDYGHPSDKTIARLLAAGAGVYTTRENGTVIIHSDGRTWRLVKAR